MSHSLEEKKQAAASPGLAEGNSVAETIPGGQPATNWYAWFTARMPWNLRDEERENLAGRQQREEATLVKTPATYYGRDVAVTDENGQVKQRAVSGTAQREEENGAFSWLRGVFSWRSGDETYATSQDGARSTRSSTFDKTVGATGSESTSTKGTKTEVVDVKATAGVAKKELEEEQARAKQELKNLAKDKGIESDAERQAKIDRAEKRLASIDKALDDVAKNPDAATLAKICAEHRLTVEAKYKVVAEDSVTEKDKLEVALWKGKINSSSEKVEKKTEGGAITATTTKSAVGTDLAAGTLFSSSSSNTQTRTNADGTSETKTIDPTKSTTATFGGGALTVKSSSSTSESTADAAGKTRTGSAKTEARDYAVLANDEDGYGFQAGKTNTRSSTTGKTTKEVETGGHIGLTDKGVLGDVSGGGKRTTDKSELAGKATANGAFLIEVTGPDEKGMYNVVTTVRAGLALTGSFGTPKKKGPDADKGNQGSVSASANAGATLVYSHAMPYDQVLAYMSEADAAETAKAAKGGGKFPEFGVLEKLNLIAHGDNTANPGAVLGSSQSAASLPAGDSVQLVLTAGGSAKLSGKTGDASTGAGADVSGGLSYSRTVAIARDKDNNVIVTIGFIDKDKLAISGNATLEGVNMKGGRSWNYTEGDEYTFKLDPNLPDYQSCYDLILGAWSREGLKALYANPQITAHVEARKQIDQHKLGHNLGVGAAGVMFNTGTDREASREITKKQDGPTGTISGGATDKAAIGIGGIEMVGVKESNKATSTVDDQGQMNVDLQRASSETSLSTTLANAGKTIKGWFGIKDGQDTKATDVLKGALAKTPTERAKELLEKQYTRLSGYKLGPADVEHLVARADDETKWMHAATSARIVIPMRILRVQLLSPDVDTSLVSDDSDEVQVDKAMKLARAQLLADFMEANGHYGMEAIEKVLRSYGESYMRESTATDLGFKYEWPESLGKQRVLYETAEKTIAGMSDKFAALLDKPDGKQQWNATSDQLVRNLDTVHAAVAESHDIRSERARAEMLDSISQKKASLLSMKKYFERASSMHQARQAGTGSTTQPEPTEAEETRVGIEMFAHERIPTLIVDLTGFKMKERELLDAAKAVGRGNRALELLSSVRELYEFWVTKVKELRQAYQFINVPAPRWTVSSGPDDARHVNTEPDVEAMIAIWKQAGGEDYRGPIDWAADWRVRWTHY